MAMHRISEYDANRLLDYEFEAGAYLLPHSGDPGENGTDNTIDGVARVFVSSFSPAAGKSTSNVDAFSFDDMPECSIAYWSAWDSLTGGNFLRSTPRITGSPLAPNALSVTEGDSVTVSEAGCVFRISNVEI
jgi:hypothetical protein